MKAIESKIKHCTICNKTTEHHRNSSSTSFVMGLVHVVLTLASAGIWLLILIVWKLLNTKVGGWKCTHH